MLGSPAEVNLASGHSAAQDEGDPDAEQADHEQPVRPRGPCPAVEDRLERADGNVAEEALGG
jgi:hypothetical protein